MTLPPPRLSHKAAEPRSPGSLSAVGTLRVAVGKEKLSSYSCCTFGEDTFIPGSPCRPVFVMVPARGHGEDACIPHPQGEIRAENPGPSPGRIGNRRRPRTSGVGPSFCPIQRPPWWTDSRLLKTWLDTCKACVYGVTKTVDNPYGHELEPPGVDDQRV